MNGFSLNLKNVPLVDVIHPDNGLSICSWVSI